MTSEEIESVKELLQQRFKDRVEPLERRVDELDRKQDGIAQALAAIGERLSNTPTNADFARLEGKVDQALKGKNGNGNSKSNGSINVRVPKWVIAAATAIGTILATILTAWGATKAGK